MLSKQDYQDYLSQIVDLEKKMSSVYSACSLEIKDEYIQKRCAGLSRAEIKHAEIVQELVKLFEDI